MILAERLSLNLTAVGFVLLGAATALEWYRHRGRAQGMLALSLVALAVVAALGRLQDAIGQSALLARRLVEAGSRFVTAAGYHSNSWDTHSDNDKGHRDRLAPPLDRTFRESHRVGASSRCLIARVEPSSFMERRRSVDCKSRPKNCPPNLNKCASDSSPP